MAPAGWRMPVLVLLVAGYLVPVLFLDFFHDHSTGFGGSCEHDHHTGTTCDDSSAQTCPVAKFLATYAHTQTAEIELTCVTISYPADVPPVIRFISISTDSPSQRAPPAFLSFS